MNVKNYFQIIFLQQVSRITAAAGSQCPALNQVSKVYISQRENEDPAQVPRQSAAGDTSWEGWPGTVNEKRGTRTRNEEWQTRIGEGHGPARTSPW